MAPKIVGAMVSPDSKAPFQEASLVVEGPKGIFVGSDEGEPFNEVDWEVLLTQREAQRLFFTPAYEPGLKLWVFRPTCVFKYSEISPALHAISCQFESLNCACELMCYVRKGAETMTFRTEWARKATRLAEDAIAVRDSDRAVAAAHTAFHLEPRMSPRATALLAHAFRLAGNATRAEGYMRSAERSFGADFGQAVREKLLMLEEYKR